MTNDCARGLADDFLARLAELGWQSEPVGPVEAMTMLDGVQELAIPEQYRELLGRFALLVSPDETRWFLSAADYAGLSDSAFSWNEIETLSLEASADEADRQRCDEFWHEFLPIALAVGGPYEYLAISRTTGAVVHGVEPEFEQTTLLADDLADFVRGVVAGDPAAAFITGS